MDSSSTSKRACMFESKEGKLQWRRERERAHRALETAAEREQRLRKRRERDRAKREAESDNKGTFTLKNNKTKQGLAANINWREPERAPLKLYKRA